MEFTDEWKSQFPVGKVFTPPLLLSGPSAKSIYGPLCFNPKLETLTPLFSSPSLCHPIDSLPQFSFSRFLSTPSVPLSTSSSIISQLESRNDTFVDSYNFLQLLHCPNSNNVIAFFSTGYNHDQLGFLLFSFKNTGCNVFTDDNNEIHVAKNQFRHRICKILVNPIGDISSSEGNSLVTIGNLLACTMHSIHWFSIKVDKVGEKPTLSYLGDKFFTSISIVSACWSPHLVEESLVLLESGTLFMFDLNSSLKTKESNLSFKGKRLKVLWNDYCCSETSKWLGCDFSWHPRILIVARSDAVFLVDLRSGDCNITVLAKIDMLNLYGPVGKEQFLTFHKAGSDDFNFVIATDSLLALYDVRKPLMPLLQWAHSLCKPNYIDVFRLSHLRANSRDSMYGWADEFGFAIVLGSFCNCEFSLFCYGPCLPNCGGVALEISKICNSLYAWDLPSDLRLSGCDCCCGDCLTRKEFFKDALPTWVDWKRKEDIVLGFGILNEDLSALLHGSDEFGGFTMVRLMSSGKLEGQRYCASWGLVKKLEPAHGDSLSRFEGNILCFMKDEDYKFPRRFKYFTLDYLNGYLSGNLTEVLDSKMKKKVGGPQEKNSFCMDFHEILCEKLKICGFSRFRTSPAISSVFNDISLPASILEVALRRIWSGLPMELLQLAFSSYAEVLDVRLNQKKTSLEFPVVPDLHQLPPFYLKKPTIRSNKWSQRVQRGDSLVGPVMPLPVVLTLHEFRNGCPNSEEADGFSSEREVNLRCDEVMQVASEMAESTAGFDFHNDHVTSLADERDNLWADFEKPKPFILYHPTAFESSTKDDTRNYYEDVKYASLISKVPEHEPFPKDVVGSIALTVLDDLSPIALKYDDACSINIMHPDLKAYNIVKREYSRYLEGYSSYQDYCKQLKLKKQQS